MFIKVFSDFICALFFAIGGYDTLYFRRFLMPIVIAVAVSISVGVWWLGLTVLPVMGTLCLGYHDGKWLKRGAWMALQASVIGIGCVLTGHLSYLLYAIYVMGAFILGATLYTWEQLVGDFIFGGWLGAISWLIHR